MLLTKKRESTLRAQVLVKKFLKVIQSYSKLLKLIAINSLNINITYWFTLKVSGTFIATARDPTGRSCSFCRATYTNKVANSDDLRCSHIWMLFKRSASLFSDQFGSSSRSGGGDSRTSVKPDPVTSAGPSRGRWRLILFSPRARSILVGRDSRRDLSSSLLPIVPSFFQYGTRSHATTARQARVGIATMEGEKWRTPP